MLKNNHHINLLKFILKYLSLIFVSYENYLWKFSTGYDAIATAPFEIEDDPLTKPLKIASETYSNCHTAKAQN